MLLQAAERGLWSLPALHTLHNPQIPAVWGWRCAKWGVSPWCRGTCGTRIVLLRATPFLCEQQAGEISWPGITLPLLVSVP